MPLTVTLPATLTIDRVETLSAQWRTLATDGAVVFDATATEIMTAPGAQLLLALDAQLGRDGGDLTLIHVRDPIAQTFRTLGLAAELARWSAGFTESSSLPV